MRLGARTVGTYSTERFGLEVRVISWRSRSDHDSKICSAGFGMFSFRSDRYRSELFLLLLLQHGHQFSLHYNYGYYLSLHYNYP